MSIEPNINIDYTDRDYEAFKEAMIAELKSKMPEYTDLSDSDAGIVIIQAVAKALDVLSYNQDSQANEVFLLTATQRQNIMKWVDMLNYTPHYATVAEFKQVFELKNPATKDYTIPQGTVVATPETSTMDAILYELADDLVIKAGDTGIETNEDGSYKYLVDIIQGYTVEQERVGASSGAKSQRFALSTESAIYNSIAVAVEDMSDNEADTFDTDWERVDSFFNSSANSKHYRVQYDDNDIAYIVFGDGIHGKIPEDGAEIVCTYRVGAGTLGNVTSNQITEYIPDAEKPLSEILRTFNPSVPEVYATDDEILDDVKVNAPKSALTREVCVRTEDYPFKALELFKYLKYASSEVNPENVDNILLYIMLEDNRDITDTQLKEIINAFKSRAIVGTSVTVTPTSDDTFVPIKLNVEIALNNRYKQSECLETSAYLLTNFFTKGNFPLGESLNVNDLEDIIREQVEGVLSVRISATEVNGVSNSLSLIPAVGVGKVFYLQNDEADINFNIDGGITEE